MTAHSPVSRLQLRTIRKYFGATKALDGVDLDIAAGEVHAIIGENGAGKSTLMKILSGAHTADAGEILLDGHTRQFHDPRQAREAGIAMIYQELNLAPDLSAAENITLGCEPRSAGWIDRRRQGRIAREALAKLSCDGLPLDTPVRRLSVAQQQMVEIARAVQNRLPTNTADPPAAPGELKLLILDEPTSSLTKLDVEHLFNVIERLKRTGVSVLYISHFLEECERIADRFTVLRDGKSVGSGRLASRDSATQADVHEPATSMDEIVRMMVGRDISELYPRFDHPLGDVVLKVDDLSGSDRPRRISFELRRGMILGLAGLIGAGRTETLRTIFGLDRLAGGRVWVQGQPSTRRDPLDSWSRDGMGLVSEDRKDEGLLLNRSLVENVTLTHFQPYRIGPFLSHRRMRSATSQWISALEIKSRDPDQPVGELSGGNQQKIALARLLHHDCEILLLDEPTRGIDIGSKSVIYRAIGQLAAAGKAILLVSSYLPELLGICDTIGVVSRGQLVELRPTSDWDEHQLLTAAIGQPEPGAVRRSGS